jgi:DNA-binding IclR family transcriptional regulator
VEPTALLADLARIRQDGYGIDREEAQVGSVCLAAPIRDARGSVVAAVSVSGISDEIKRRSEAELVDAVIRCGESISRRLGYSYTNGNKPSVPSTRYR